MKKNELPIHEISFPKAKELADCVSIFQDLTYVVEAFKRLMESSKSKDVIFLRSLWTGALVAYARCFQDGKRFGLSKDIYKSLNGEPVDCHEFLMNMRNRHIAHSVNPFEDCKVGAIVQDGKKVVGIISLHSAYLLPSKKEDIETFLRLCLFARNYIKDRCEVLTEECTEEAKSLDIKQIVRVPTVRLTAPSSFDARKVRGKD